jgi:hypothetical protein
VIVYALVDDRDEPGHPPGFTIAFSCCDASGKRPREIGATQRVGPDGEDDRDRLPCQTQLPVPCRKVEQLVR